jgi:hypothetical protein
MSMHSHRRLVELLDSMQKTLIAIRDLIESDVRQKAIGQCLHDGAIEMNGMGGRPTVYLCTDCNKSFSTTGAVSPPQEV